MAQAQQYQVIQPAEVSTGMVIRIHQRITEVGSKETKERVQVYEGMVLNVRGKSPNRTMTVRKVSNGVGVEKIFPLNLPTIEKIEAVKQYKARRKNMSVVAMSKKRLKEVPIRLARMKASTIAGATPAIEASTTPATEVPNEAAPATEPEQNAEAGSVEEKQPA